MAELWDAYDRRFNKIENLKLVRGKPIPDGVYHLVCSVIVKHTDGTYLLMRRDINKSFGGMWELTAGGSALAGETPLECAIRELNEETGIISSDLKEIKRSVRNSYHCLFVDYLCITECDKTSVTLQKGETIDYKWVDEDTVLKMKKDTLASIRTQNIIKRIREEEF